MKMWVKETEQMQSNHDLLMQEDSALISLFAIERRVLAREKNGNLILIS